jgi:hypothetical protein
VSSNRVTTAPAREEGPEVVPENATPVGGGSTNEYVVKKLVDDRVDSRRGRLFRVRWLGYRPDENTWEEEAGIPQHFIDRYRRTRALH